MTYAPTPNDSPGELALIAFLLIITFTVIIICCSGFHYASRAAQIDQLQRKKVDDDIANAEAEFGKTEKRDEAKLRSAYNELLRYRKGGLSKDVANAIEQPLEYHPLAVDAHEMLFNWVSGRLLIKMFKGTLGETRMITNIVISLFAYRIINTYIAIYYPSSELTADTVVFVFACLFSFFLSSFDVIAEQFFNPRLGGMGLWRDDDFDKKKIEEDANKELFITSNPVITAAAGGAG